jgi:hypothetical protein
MITHDRQLSQSEAQTVVKHCRYTGFAGELAREFIPDAELEFHRGPRDEARSAGPQQHPVKSSYHGNEDFN